MTDPAQSTAFSIWRVRNNSAMSYRANLEASSGERIPLLVRTNSEVALRSDSLDATANHSAGNINAALECMMPGVAASYSGALTSLQSSLPQIVTSFSDIHPTGAAGLVEYVLMRNVNGQPTAFLIYFARGSDGVWRIAGM